MTMIDSILTDSKLKKALTVFFKYYREKDTEIYDMYLEKLKKYDETEVINRLSNLMEISISNFLPKIGVILEPIERVKGDIAWIRFKKYCFERYTPVPDDVYTICKIIGRDRLDNCTKEDFEVWIKKEFMEVYKNQEGGMYEQLADPRKETHKQLDSGNWVKPHRSENKVMVDFAKIKEILK